MSLLVALCLWTGAGAAGAAVPSPQPRWAGRPLAEALQELRSLGLRIVFTTGVVLPEMSVLAEPAASDPRGILDEILAPHGLEARVSAGGTLVVVPRREAEEPTSVRLEGLVRSRDGLAPVAGAQVRVLESGAETWTDSAGTFRIEVARAGAVTLEVGRRGFAVRRVEGVKAGPGEPALSVVLDPVPELGEELVITPSRLSLLAEEPGAPIGLGRDEISALPHLGDDLFRAFSLLPGTAANDVSAQFHIRGGYRDETQILLDGQEVFEAYHLKDYDSALSVVDSQSLSRAELSTGGFPAPYGDRMSGVLEMVTEAPEGPVKGRVGVSLLSTQVGGEGTFHSGRGSWLAQARRGSIEFADKLLGDGNPAFWDAFGKVEYQLDVRSSLRANLLHAGDELEFEQVLADESKRNDTEYRSTYLWLTHERVFGAHLLVETAASFSQVDRDRRGIASEEDVEFGIRDERDLDVLGLRQAWSLDLSERHFLEWGFGLRSFETQYDYTGSHRFENTLPVVREGFLEGSTAFHRRFRDGYGTAYFSDRLRLGSTLTLELGLRYDRYSRTREGHLSPRLNLAVAAGRDAVVRLAWGRFHQSQRPYELQVEDGETAFSPVERSEHRVVGFEKRFGGSGGASGLQLRIEAYRRAVFNPRPRFVNLYEPLNTFPEVEPDRVRLAPERSVAKGVEVLVRGRVGPRLGWWVNYAYAASEDKTRGRWTPRPFDQTHTLNLNLDFRIGPRWRLDAAWRYHTGWPTTPLTLESRQSVDGDAEFAPVLGALFSRRLAGYHRLDVRASRSWRAGPGTVTFFLDVQNLYNRRNHAGFDIVIDQEIGRLVADREEWAGILPSLGVIFTF